MELEDSTKVKLTAHDHLYVHVVVVNLLPQYRETAIYSCHLRNSNTAQHYHEECIVRTAICQKAPLRLKQYWNSEKNESAPLAIVELC